MTTNRDVPTVARGDLFEIRRMLARAGTFDGYRATPVAVSGALALVAGALQRLLQPGPIAFVTLWVATAAVCFGVNVYVVARSYGASPRAWERSLALAALLDLVPAMVGGLLLTVALVVRGDLALLPGTWMTLYGIGVMASRRHVPRPCAWIGVAYLLAGTVTLLLLPGELALRADVMAGAFGLGQFLLAIVLTRAPAAARATGGRS
jgi:hypothetical protein